MLCYAILNSHPAAVVLYTGTQYLVQDSSRRLAISAVVFNCFALHTLVVFFLLLAFTLCLWSTIQLARLFTATPLLQYFTYFVCQSLHDSRLLSAFFFVTIQLDQLIRGPSSAVTTNCTTMVYFPYFYSVRVLSSNRAIPN